MSSSSTPLQESASPRFRELLKELHDSENVCRVEAERVRCCGEFAAISLLEHYREGCASWVFNVQAPVEIDEDEYQA